MDDSTKSSSGNTRARFEQWAKNPACQANTLSAVHNVSMAEVTRRLGYRPTFGQSVFALTRGDNFERELLRKGAKRLLEELTRKGVLPQGAQGLADFRIGMNGGPLPSLDVAIEATKELIRGLPDKRDPGSPRCPGIVAGATVRIPRGVMLPEAVLILDILAIRYDRNLPELMVGEVKTYADRGGHTDMNNLAVARAQAGLYMHALELLLADLNCQKRVLLRADGFLVLTRPGSNFPSVRANEDLRFQAERARRGFELLEAAALGLPPFEPIADDPVAAVIASETDYSEACLRFCDRVGECHSSALDAGSPAVLGDELPRFLGGLNLNRVVQLLNGEEPQTDAEHDVMRRIRANEPGSSP